MTRVQLPILNLTQTVEAIIACIVAERVPLVLGAPGIGKSSLLAPIAAAVGMPGKVMIASNYEGVDIGGIPIPRGDGRVTREVFGPIADAIHEPTLIGLDEATTVTASVWGPLMRFVLERFAGDQPLHSKSRIVAFANPPEQAPGGIELSAAVTNRMIMLRVQPSIEEIEAFFSGTPIDLRGVAAAAYAKAEEYKATRAAEMADFAAILEHVDLLQLEPPSASIEAGDPWGSPRGWEAGLSAFAALCRDVASGRDDLVGYAILSGAVGPYSAANYLGVREARKELPTWTEIVADPLNAKVPESKQHQIAALGVINRVAAKDTGAAWIYADRLSDEFAAVAAKQLMAMVYRDATHAKAGRVVMARRLARTQALIRGTAV